MTDSSLIPVEQKKVIFYEDEVTAVRLQDGTIYVPVRPICRLLGLNWDAQRRRILRDPVLSEEAKGVVVTTTPGGEQEMTCLPLDYLSGFLFGVNATRVKSELKERVILYQRECYKVLAEAFREGRLTVDPIFDDLLAMNSAAAQAYKMATAIMQMARQQLLLEAQIKSHTSQLTDHEQRIEQIESTLGDPGHHITPDQAMQISQAVKTVAIALEKKTGRNEYGAVYGQLYREFGITSYKQLPAGQFDSAITWLTEWYHRITGATGGAVPF